MDKVFSLEKISDPFWSPQSPKTALNKSLKMNRCASEWAFQRFLQEASSASHSLPLCRSPSPSPSSSSSSSAADQNDIVEVKFKDHQYNSKFTKSASNTSSFDVGPPNLPIDSEEYQAFLKSKLHLACAVVASRGSFAKAQDSAALADSLSQAPNTSSLGTHDLSRGAGYDLVRSQDKDLNGLLGIQKKSGNSVESTSSGSSKEQTDDEDLEDETEATQYSDRTDSKRVRRMLSNRESARRSRRRKQAHMTELETQVAELRDKNSSLLKRLTDISQNYTNAAVDNRVLKANVETLRAKVMMAEEQVKRIAGLNPNFHAFLNLSSISTPSFDGSVSETSTDAAVTVQDDSNNNLYQPVSSNSIHLNDQRVNSSLTKTSSVENVKHNSPAAVGGGNKMGRTASSQRVASLEHLQKRIRGDGKPRELQSNGNKC